MADSLSQAHDQMYAALNTMLTGDAGPILDLWSDADDVTYGGPFGRFVAGRAGVVAAFEDSAARHLQGSIDVSDVHMVEGEDIGYTVCIEHGRDHVIDGKPANLTHRATNIFRREGDEWRLVHHHTDSSAT